MKHLALLPLLALLALGACKTDDDGGSDNGGGNNGGGDTDPGPVCPGDDEVRYVSDDPEVCMRIRYACNEGESYWSDPECGCGCELPEPEGQPCGGIAGFTCAEGYFCAFPAETSCGSGDQMGACATRPDACIALYKPVCGCDGHTYSNSCAAASAGVSVSHDGECGGGTPIEQQ